VLPPQGRLPPATSPLSSPLTGPVPSPSSPTLSPAVLHRVVPSSLLGLSSSAPSAEGHLPLVPPNWDHCAPTLPSRQLRVDLGVAERLFFPPPACARIFSCSTSSRSQRTTVLVFRWLRPLFGYVFLPHRPLGLLCAGRPSELPCLCGARCFLLAVAGRGLRHSVSCRSYGYSDLLLLVALFPLSRSTCWPLGFLDGTFLREHS
jgi:hypothetical protein